MAMEIGKILSEIFIVMVLLYIAFRDYQDFIVSNNSLLLLFMGEICYVFFCEQELYSLLKSMGISIVIFGSIYYLSKNGMGAGDVKLAVVLSVWLGYPQVWMAFCLSFILGGIVAVLCLVRYKVNFVAEKCEQEEIKHKIPFAPMMVISAIAVHFCYMEIISIWHGFIA